MIFICTLGFHWWSRWKYGRVNTIDASHPKVKMSKNQQKRQCILCYKTEINGCY